MTTTVITCDCKVCNGKAAEIPAGSQYEQITTGNNKTARAARHNLICLANSALYRGSNRYPKAV